MCSIPSEGSSEPICREEMISDFLPIRPSMQCYVSQCTGIYSVAKKTSIMKIKPGTRHSDEEDGILIFIELKII